MDGADGGSSKGPSSTAAIVVAGWASHGWGEVRGWAETEERGVEGAERNERG